MLAVAVIAGILFVWALLAHRLSRWSITAPIAMMCAGIALTGGSDPPLRFDLDTNVFEHAVEVVLALLLFVDAIEVPGEFSGGRRASSSVCSAVHCRSPWAARFWPGI